MRDVSSKVEHPAFNRRELGSIPRRPTPSGVGVKVTQQALNLIEASSILVPPTDSLQCPAAWDSVSETEEEGSTPSTASEKIDQSSLLLENLNGT